jgi:hypothetical protein
MFQILPEFIDIYRDTVENGKLFLNKKNICVIGLTRDNEKLLETNLSKIDSLSNYANLKYFLYENDSIDRTPEILKKIELNNFNFISEKLYLQKFGTVKDSSRTIALSKHRNQCLEYVKNNYTDCEYTIVLDLDYKTISIEGLLHSFGLFSLYCDIDAIAGFSYEIKNNNGYKFLWNYDCWAYRQSWWADLQLHGSSIHKDPMLWFGFFSPPIGSNPIQVYSAFGGCCIYKTNKFIQGIYSGEDCEHVTFNKNLKDKFQTFKIVANPSQIMVF